MTYKELYDSAVEKLDRNLITLGEYEKMIEPLDDEIMTAEPKWIPVTERLPKVQYGESKPVLVTECWKYDNGTSFAIRTAEYDGGVWHDGTGNVFTETKVIAWMPLPEPYKENEE